MKKIVIDIDKCIAAGHCVKAAPEVFAQDEETGLVLVLRDTIGEADEPAAAKAARMCPALVISVVDDQPVPVPDEAP